MFAIKDFEGIHSFSQGPETEPGSAPRMDDELARSLTALAYALFDIQQGGVSINFDAVVEAIVSGVVNYNEIFTVNGQETGGKQSLPSVQAVRDALATLDPQRNNDQFQLWLGGILYAYDREMIGNQGASVDQGTNYSDKLHREFEDISSAMLSSGSTITNEGAFKESLIKAVQDSDQGGLESSESM